MTKVITIFSCANDLHKIVILRWRIAAPPTVTAPAPPAATAPAPLAVASPVQQLAATLSKRCAANTTTKKKTTKTASSLAVEHPCGHACVE